MSFVPQRPRSDGWIDTRLPPPGGFVAAAVHLAMVSATQWDGELIADLLPERAALREPNRIGWAPAADQTRTSRYESHMLSIADATWFRKGERAFVDRCGL